MATINQSRKGITLPYSLHVYSFLSSPPPTDGSATSNSDSYLLLKTDSAECVYSVDIPGENDDVHGACFVWTKCAASLVA